MQRQGRLLQEPDFDGMNLKVSLRDDAQILDGSGRQFHTIRRLTGKPWTTARNAGFNPPAMAVDETNSLIAQRKAKLHALRQQGIDPFRNKFTPTETCAVARAN